jgi:two-component system, sensor histidine kinase and response regulator
MNNKTISDILIVDDEPTNIYLLEGLLTHEGYSILTARNGSEAIDKLKNCNIEIVLLDIMMPEITGIDVLKYLMNTESLKDIPVIMVSAKAEAEDVEEALELGAVDYIKKPINEIELLARIKTVIRLKRKEDELKQLLKSKEDFINMVSHDVRTPFASITGFAELLLNDLRLNKNYSPEHQEFLNFIIDTSNYLYDYFNKLLFWANMGSNELQLKRSNVQLLKIINASAVIFRSKLENKKQELTINCDEKIIVNVDVTYFSQVINNLFNNSIKYTPDEGNISIISEVRQGKVSIMVKDTGIGMNDISREELFGLTFHRSKNGTRGEKGTGIGLRICKKILDAHGFSLDFISKAGEGTSFIIECRDN